MNDDIENMDAPGEVGGLRAETQRTSATPGLAAEDLQRQLDRLLRAGVVRELAELVCTGHVEQSEAVEALRDELNSGARFVILSGGVGVGKSVAAAWWLKRALERHGTADISWLHAHQLARLTGYDTVAQLEGVECCDFLVIDDLGLEYLDAKGWLATAIDSIVYQRHGNRRLTVCTTNLGAADFRSRYGERVADRIRACGVFVEIAGKSLRRPLAGGSAPSAGGSLIQ